MFSEIRRTRNRNRHEDAANLRLISRWSCREPSLRAATFLPFPTRAAGKTTAYATVTQESVVMALDQMCFNLTHRIEHHTNDNEQTGAAEKLCGHSRHVQTLAQQTWQHSDDRQKNRAGERQPRHC